MATGAISIMLKNIPEDLLGELRLAAEEDRRSLTREAFVLLAEAPSRCHQAGRGLEGTRRRWKSDRAPEEEIADLYAARSDGREVDL